MSKYSGIIANEKTREAYMMGWQDGLETFGEGKLLGAKEEMERILKPLKDIAVDRLTSISRKGILMKDLVLTLSNTRKVEGLE